MSEEKKPIPNQGNEGNKLEKGERSVPLTEKASNSERNYSKIPDFKFTPDPPPPPPPSKKD